MNRLAIALLACATLAGATTAHAGAIRFSQVYGGGGASTGSPTYKSDYVELFNNSGVPVLIEGWKLNYSSSGGTFNTTNTFTFPTGATIQPCSYALVALGTPGSAGGNLPLAPDYTGTNINMSATAGKIALTSAGSAASQTCPGGAGATVEDFVGYGAANCAEGTAVGTLANTSGAVRNGNGTIDSNNNSSDFTIVANPVPRNSQSSKPSECTTTPVHAQTWGAVKMLYR